MATSADPASDLMLRPADRELLLDTIASIFSDESAARSLLMATSFPAGAMPAFTVPVDFWSRVFTEFDKGVMPAPYRALLAAALRRYPFNPVLGDLGSRHELAPPAREKPDPAARTLRVLVIGASPADRPLVHVGEECRAIQKAAEFGHLTIDLCLAAQAVDLVRVRELRPDIVHFVLHGDGENLIFQDIHAESHLVPADDVVAALRHYREKAGIRLRGIVLASCYGRDIAHRFAAVADRVVAHDSRLDGNCAVVFAGAFYEALRKTDDLGDAAETAALRALHTDASCADVRAGLLVLPETA